MNTVSITGSLSRRAGGLFESVRRLHQELLRNTETLKFRNSQIDEPVSAEIKVKVLGLRDDFTDEDYETWHPVPIRPLEIVGPKCFGYAPDFARMLRTVNPDLVHVHGLWQYGSLATLNWHRGSRAPYIISPHGMLDPWALRNSRWRLPWLAYERSHLHRAGCIRALCRSEAVSIRALGLRAPICVIPNGVDLPKDNGAAASRQCDTKKAMPSAVKVLLYLGGLHRKKGLSTLLRAWAAMQTPPDWVLVIAGWDQEDHESELKRLASELGICWSDELGRRPPASVFFIGPKFGAAKREWLKRSDAVILPSLSEGVPMSILEAWAHGKPALITPQCHLAEGISAGAAIRIDPKIDAVIGGLQRMFKSDRATLERMGTKGRELIARRFDWPKIISDLKSVYRWLITGGQKPDCVISREETVQDVSA